MTSLTEVFEKVGNFDKEDQVVNDDTRSFMQPLKPSEVTIGS